MSEEINENEHEDLRAAWDVYTPLPVHGGKNAIKSPEMLCRMAFTMTSNYTIGHVLGISPNTVMDAKSVCSEIAYESIVAQYNEELDLQLVLLPWAVLYMSWDTTPMRLCLTSEIASFSCTGSMP